MQSVIEALVQPGSEVPERILLTAMSMAGKLQGYPGSLGFIDVERDMLQ